MEIFDYSTIAIKRIKPLRFFLDEDLVKQNSGNMLQEQIAITFGHNISLNIVNLTINIIYRYQDATIDKIASELSVQNIFELKELSSYVKEDVVILPQPVITTLIAVGIGHSRGIFATYLSGTVLNDMNLGLINPEAVAKHFFPYMF
jgi:hypothetical protein